MKNKKHYMHTLKWLWKFSGNCKLSILLLTVLQCVLGVTGVLFAWLFRGMVDSATAKDAQNFLYYALFIVSLVIINIILGAINRFLNENTQSSIENTFKSRLFTSILSKDYSEVTTLHTGEWMNRLTTDTAIVARGLTSIIPEIAGMIVKLFSALGLMLMLVPQFVYILVPGGLVIVFITYLFRKKLKSMHKDIQEANGKLRIFMTERLSNLLIIKSFVRESQVEKMAKDLMQNHKDKRIDRVKFSNFCNICFSIVFNGAYIISAIYCGYGILIGRISYGTFVAVIQLVNQIQSPFANITSYLPVYYATTASAERLMEVESFKDDWSKKFLDSDKIKEFYEDNFKSISIENLDFKYDKKNGPEVLNNLNLTVSKGEFIAFTGVSGVGKSTILKLLMNIYKPDKGSIMLKTSTKDVYLTANYRRLFAYVPQGNYLMSGSIKDVVSFNKEMTEDQIWEALKIACADSFIETLQDTIDTNLGEGGSGLSEGQMQRVAIARAIASDHPILLLDECTSSLDAKTEEKLLKNIKSMTDKTVIIVTHRKKALEFCDKQLDM